MWRGNVPWLPHLNVQVGIESSEPHTDLRAGKLASARDGKGPGSPGWRALDTWDLEQEVLVVCMQIHVCVCVTLKVTAQRDEQGLEASRAAPGREAHPPP